MTKVALVTGGAKGIGRAIAEDLARDHDIAFTWLSTPPAAPPGRLALRADLAQDGAAEAVVAATLARFGRLDAMVNNAGVVAPTPKEHFDRAAQHAILDVNLLAPAALLAAALPHLGRGAAIVSLSRRSTPCCRRARRRPMAPARRR